MVVHKFAATADVRAVRRALDFWYRSLRGRISAIGFLFICEWVEMDGTTALVFDSDKLPIGSMERK